ncbi:MIT C-terminal domain-containing protein [Gemmatimonadota bacterium]
MKHEDIELINQQINNEESLGNQEIHLYIYSSDPKLGVPSLHVGKIAEVRGEDQTLLNDPHTPDIYSRLEYPVPFWFKLTDIRTIPLRRINDLVDFHSGSSFDPNTRYPLPHLLKETPPKSYFADRKLNNSAWKHWWEQVLYDGSPEAYSHIDRMLSIEKGEAYNFGSLFTEYLESARHITIVDPYIRRHHQINNIKALLELVENPQGTTVRLITDFDEGQRHISQHRLNDLSDHLTRKGYLFSWQFDSLHHDRYIETEKWEIYLGRGLDFIEDNKAKKCHIFIIQK